MRTKPIKMIAVIAALTAAAAVLTACNEKDFDLRGPERELTDGFKAAKQNPPVVMRVIAKGSALHGANGINFGPDGNLYIGSVQGREIIVMNKLNGKIIKRLGSEVGVLSPDDLVFGPDGSLYWTDIMEGYVGRLTPGGVVTKQFLARGVNPITFSADGRLFVGLCFLGDGLYELDPELTAPPRPIIEATPSLPYPLGFLNAFDFGPDGRLYGPVFSQGLVISVDVGMPGDPPSANPWGDGTIQVVAAGLKNPAAVKFAPDGQLIVLDQTGEVFSVNHLTEEIALIATLEDGLDNLAFDADGRMYISNADHGWIVQMLPSGQARTISTGGMIIPMGVAVMQGPDGKDVVYVADLFRLRTFNGQTGKPGVNYKGHLVPSPVSPSLTLPISLSADGGNLVVSSWFSSAVQVWNPKTDQVLEHYSIPAPLNAIRFKDDIVVAALGLGGVVWADGSMILPMDGINIYLPVGLLANGEVLWVADWATGVVWQIAFDGKTPQTPVPLAFGLANPEGMAMDMDGSLLVMEAGAGRISRIDPATGAVSLVVDGLKPGIPGPAGFPPSWGFDGLAVGPSGAIYFTDHTNNTLSRIWPR